MNHQPPLPPLDRRPVKICRHRIRECFMRVMRDSSSLRDVASNPHADGPVSDEATREAWQYFLLGFRCYERTIGTLNRELTDDELQLILDHSP